VLASQKNEAYFYLYLVAVQEIDLPDSLSNEMRTLLEGLLQREVCNRTGCRGAGYAVLHLN